MDSHTWHTMTIPDESELKETVMSDGIWENLSSKRWVVGNIKAVTIRTNK